jgi:murein DD-endopeptidase MepM/ murein hydrolase activator NlpD
VVVADADGSMKSKKVMSQGHTRPSPSSHGARRSSRPTVRPNHIVTLMASITALGLVSFLLSHDAIARFFAPAHPDSVTMPLDIPPPAASELAPDSSPEDWQSVTVVNGDNLYSILGRLGFDPVDTQRILEAGPSAATLNRLIPGQRIRMRYDRSDLAELIYENDGINVVQIRRGQNGFEVGNVKRNLETRMSYSTGIVDSSLFLAAQQSGLSVNLTIQLANIFGWDVDFALDIRKGDRFTVVYEEIYSSGEKVRDGAIIAAEFVNSGKTHRAVRYQDTDGHVDYYNPSGQNLRKAFLRTPVDVSRISSGFGMRFHPVLNRMKAHHGVDYAAPMGTPIRVTGDGTVRIKGNRSGYGKTIVIDHGNGYETLYAHMSQFRSDLKPGMSVKQGQIIGYVGNTGLATGPHLHYEFRVAGTHRDPLTIKLPSAAPIAQNDLMDFKEKTTRYVGLLDSLNKTNIALTE